MTPVVSFRIIYEKGCIKKAVLKYSKFLNFLFLPCNLTSFLSSRKAFLINVSKHFTTHNILIFLYHSIKQTLFIFIKIELKMTREKNRKIIQK